MRSFDWKNRHPTQLHRRNKKGHPARHHPARLVSLPGCVFGLMMDSIGLTMSQLARVDVFTADVYATFFLTARSALDAKHADVFSL